MGTLIVRLRAAKQVGFTLIELMVTVTIVGIIATLAAPAMQKMILAQNVRSGASDLQTALYFARSEAIKRATNVDVAPASGDWKNGWVVQLSGGGAVLRSQSALGSQLSSMSGSTITYRSDGRITATTTPATIAFTTSNVNVQARCIKIDLSGRPNVTNYAYGGGTNTCS